MKLQIRKFGDPILRQKGARIEKITPEIKKLVAGMFDTMYDARGVGLAAQQVGHALQLAIIDVRGIKDRPSTMQIEGKLVEPEAHMPLVLINPILKLGGETFRGAEGCLSFPEVFAEITRPAEVDVVATNDHGEKISFHAGGLLAKAVQHEFDHLQGILFIDRMSSEAKRELKPELDALADQVDKIAIEVQALKDALANSDTELSPEAQAALDRLSAALQTADDLNPDVTV